MPSVAIWRGELEGGRSATWPTRLRSTSRRTRIDLQNSQTVCTALDQRNWIGAPQLGQLAVGELTGRAARCAARVRRRRRTQTSDTPRIATRGEAGSKTGSGTKSDIPERYGRPGATPPATTSR